MDSASAATRAKNFKERWFALKKKIRAVVPSRLLNWYFGFYPLAGSLIFGRPSRKIKLVGVTGTDGKSSTIIFAAKILRKAGYKVGFFSSVAYSDGNTNSPNTFKMTMPGRFFVQRFLKKLADNQCDFGVIEVTSEGIKQRRHLFIDFDIVLVTNIKPEHIESHGGFENYKLAKSAIFRNITAAYQKSFPKTIIVNNDDTEAKNFLSFNAEQKLTFGISERAAVRGRILSAGLFRNVFRVETKTQSIQIDLPGGPFIAENVLAAIAIAQAAQISLETCASALAKIPNPPGRFEFVAQEPFIIVDYAHTIAAVEKLLSFLKQHWTGKIIHVFGAAGGGRDKWKRPRLAELSEQYTDFSILTEENSFDEPIADILQDIYGGFRKKERVAVIFNRTEAVQKAIETQKHLEKTLLLLTGKGCETVIAGPLNRKIPYNEKQTILCLLDNC